jgi:hypothetical protein
MLGLEALKPLRLVAQLQQDLELNALELAL